MCACALELYIHENEKICRRKIKIQTSNNSKNISKYTQWEKLCCENKINKNARKTGWKEL